MPQRGTGSQAVRKDAWATRGGAKSPLPTGLFRRHFLVDQEARDPRPLLAQQRRFAHFGVEPLRGEIVPPAAAIDEFDEMGLPTLRQGEPFARDTVVRTSLSYGPCFRSDMAQPEAPVDSALPHSHRRV